MKFVEALSSLGRGNRILMALWAAIHAGNALLLAAILGLSDPLGLSNRVQAKREACDRAVSSLLATNDLVELERSKYLVDKLDCGVSQRLPLPRSAADGR